MATPGNSIQIDRLWMGESGAAPWRRKAGQVSSAKNVRFDIAIGGAVKRNPTQLIADLDGESGSDFDPGANYYFVALRDAIIAIGREQVHGWTQAGVPLNVIDETAGAFATYINTNPLINIGTCASFDTMIVLNRRKVVTTTDAWTYQQSLRYIINADITNNTGVPAINADPIPSGQYVDTFDELELVGPSNGDVYRVLFDHEFDPSGVYVYWDGAVHADAQGYFPQHGRWFRIPQSGQGQGQYTASTMPHRIVYDDDALTLTLQTCPWRQRVSGNQQTNKRMSFSGSRIQDVQFKEGRLFLISQTSTCASRTSDFFNLWVNNVNAVADDDRIDLDITESGIGRVLRAVVCGSSLMIVCENAQLQFHSGSDPLTNSNGRHKRITTFQALDIDVAASADVVILVDEFGDVHRFDYSTPDSGGIIYTERLTIHRQKLLEGTDALRPFLIDTTLFLTTDEDHARVHDSFGLQGEIVQSAWGTFEMQDYPVFFGAWGGRINVITRRYASGASGRYTLLSYVHREIEKPGDMLYMPRMDRMELIAPADMTYTLATNRTSMRHTGSDPSETLSCVVLTQSGKRHVFQRAAEVNSDGTVEFSGDLTGAEVYLGFTFDTELVLTKLYPGLTSQAADMTRLTVFHYESTDYSIQGEMPSGQLIPAQPWKFQPQRVGISQIGVPVFETHFKEFTTFQGDSRRMEITLSSSSPGQVAWLGLEYQVGAGARGTT